MWLLAYGEFDSTTFWEIFFEVLPFLIQLVAPAIGLYIFAILIAASTKHRVMGILVYVVGVALLAPSLWVGGAWGPAHVAFEVGTWAYPAFFVLLVTRTIVMYKRERRSNSDNSGRCPQCGYNLRGALDKGCSECGWNRAVGATDNYRESVSR